MKQLSWSVRSPQQMQSAINDVFFIQETISEDPSGCCAQCASSTTGEVYHTTLHDCTCVGFKICRAPCKHMIRLAVDAGFLNAEGSPIAFASKDEPTCANDMERLNQSKRKKAKPKKLKKACLPLVNLRTHEALVEEVTVRDIKYVDCLDKNGSFWLEYTNDSALFVAKYTFKGRFALRTAHSRHFKGKPAWFFNPVEP